MDKKKRKTKKIIMILMLGACCLLAGCHRPKENHTESEDYRMVAEAYVQAVKTADGGKLYPYLPYHMVEEELSKNGIDMSESEKTFFEHIQQKLTDLKNEHMSLHFWNCSIGRALDCSRERIEQFYSETYPGKNGCEITIDQMKEVIINYSWDYDGKYQADVDILYIARINDVWYLLKSDWLEYNMCCE